jgi:hypothetical protein
MNFRFFPPATINGVPAGDNPAGLFTPPGGPTQTLTGSVGSTYDVADPACTGLDSASWTRLCGSGTTGQRPSLGVNGRGTFFIDTTVGSVIAFDGATWRDPMTGSSV